MKTTLIILAIAVLPGCSQQGEVTVSVNNRFTVDKLFTHEGCTVYRFYDGGAYRYYTNCSGSTQWVEGCGKGCVRQNGVSGGGK